MRRGIVFLVPALAACALAELGGVFEGSRDDPAIHYAAPSHDAIIALNRKIQEGAVQLKSDGPTGYLRSVLEQLGIPVESQIVAFAKTSVQQARISPDNPRTLFFNDSVAVGFVHGGFIEAAAQDPAQGLIFYALDQGDQTFKRRDSCLSCHLSYATLGIPGALLRSVYPNSGGLPMYQAGSYVTDHRSPMEQRFGGWYVTGGSGPNRHLGNATLTDPDRPESMLADKPRQLESLNQQFDTSQYLSPYSDIAALMVFHHQMRMMNLLTRIGWEARLGHPLGDAAAELADYMLFLDEAPLAGPMRSTSGFAEVFAARGPTDRRGRSLRQLDLERRLMRYPCSYMIYSEAFDALPATARDATYRHMWQILSGRQKSKLTAADRQAVVEVLRDTKKDLPDYFRLQ